MVRRLSIAALVLALALLAAVGLTFWYVCPCERTPGGPLQFAEVKEPIEDWGFANQVGLCQLEVQAFVPWSVNLNCMSHQQKLYISCARCDGKFWSTIALRNDTGRIAVGDRVYPVRMRRVLDPLELDLAWRARGQKTGRGLNLPRVVHWWSFELTSVQGL
jgi:hypothetical protein